MSCTDAAAHLPTPVGVAFVLGACYQSVWHHTDFGDRTWGGEPDGD